MRLVIFLLFVLLSQTAPAQKFLQLERVHSPKTRKFQPGDEITFQMVNGQWYTRVIEDVNYDQQMVQFARGGVSVDSIIALRSFKNKRWSQSLGNQLLNFAVAWTVYSLIAAAVDSDDRYSRADAGVALAGVATWQVLPRVFRQRTFRMQKKANGEAKKWRLRVLDLEVKSPNP